MGKFILISDYLIFSYLLFLSQVLFKKRSVCTQQTDAGHISIISVLISSFCLHSNFLLAFSQSTFIPPAMTSQLPLPWRHSCLSRDVITASVVTSRWCTEHVILICSVFILSFSLFFLSFVATFLFFFFFILLLLFIHVPWHQIWFVIFCLFGFYRFFDLFFFSSVHEFCDWK